MSKIFSYYETKDDGSGVEHAWYDSSNIKYTECIDEPNKLKKLKVVFTTGAQYQYNDVPVDQYLVFREDASQGKALNRLIKGGKYEYSKLENADIGELDDELMFRSENGFFIVNDDETFKIKDCKDNVVYESEHLDDKNFEMVENILKSVGIIAKKI